MEFQRSLGVWRALFAAISAMVGSGWLFSSLYAAQLAGPAAIFSWLIAGVFISIIVFTYLEIATLIPVSGGLANYSFITHGRFVGFILGWLTWLTFVTIPVMEVQAAIQYGSHFFPSLINSNSDAHSLTIPGYITATVLMLLLVIINNRGLKFLADTNLIFTIWKLIIPALAIGVMFYYSTGFASLFTKAPGGFAPNGMHGIFSALSLAGVILSFNGFQVGFLMAGEMKNPSRNIPRALLGSVAICLVLYGLLQLAFLLAVPANELTEGWQKLVFPSDAGPIAALCLILGASLTAVLLYIDAVISPLGAGLVNVTSSARLLYALGKMQFLPPAVTKLNKRSIPEVSTWINFTVGMLMFLPLPGWKAMASFLSDIIVASFAIVPICLFAMRKNLPDLKRPFTLPCYKVFTFAAFYICNLMLYWSGWEIIHKLIFSLSAGAAVYLGYLTIKGRLFSSWHDVKNITWLFIYYVGFGLISKFGSYNGGTGAIPEGVEYVLIAILSIVILFLAQKILLTKEQSAENLQIILSHNKSVDAEVSE